MKTATKIIIGLFAFLLLASILSYDAEAAPPAQVFNDVTGGGLELKISNLPAVKVGEPYNLKIHIYNGSDGYPVYSAASCYLHLYNQSLNHVAESIATAPEHTFDYELAVSATNFSKEGYYPYVVQCNTSSQGGFLAGYIEATFNGNPKSENPTLLFAFILLPLIFGGLLLYGAMQMGDEHTAIKLTTWLLIPVFFFTSFHFTMLSVAAYYPISAFSDIIGSTTYWIGIVSGVLLTYFIIYFIYIMIKSAAEAKANKLEY